MRIWVQVITSSSKHHVIKSRLLLQPPCGFWFSCLCWPDRRRKLQVTILIATYSYLWQGSIGYNILGRTFEPKGQWVGWDWAKAAWGNFLVLQCKAFQGFFSGCITEANTNFPGHDIGQPTKLENRQACAEHCASIDGGLFWTFSHDTKYCYVKSSDSGRKTETGFVSGNRACGVVHPLVPLGVAVSQRNDEHPPHQCTMCRLRSRITLYLLWLCIRYRVICYDSVLNTES